MKLLREMMENFKSLMDSGYEGMIQAIELAESMGIPTQDLPWTAELVLTYVDHHHFEVFGRRSSGMSWDKEVEQILEPTGWTWKEYKHAWDRRDSAQSIEYQLAKSGWLDEQLLRESIRRLMLENSQSDSLVIVDVQPAYENNADFDIGEMLMWAHENYSNILVLWNGPDLGFVDQQGLKSFYFEKLGEHLGDYEQADELLWELGQKAEFFDKGYGFFRDLMDDSRCYPREHIVKIVKYMLANGVTMLYDLTEEQFAEIDVPDLLFDELEDYGFSIPELADILEAWNGSDMVGGDEDECMAEVLILASAMGLSFNKIPQYVY